MAAISDKDCIIQNFRLVWLDSEINAKDNNLGDSVVQLRHFVNTINIFTGADQCIDFLSDVLLEKVFMIVSGNLIQSLISLIHDIAQLSDIFVISDNQDLDEQSAKNWSKVRGIFSNVNHIHNLLEQAIRSCDLNNTPISFVSVDNALNTNIDQLDQSFMYTQILKEILFQIEYSEQSVHDFIVFCKHTFADNNSTLSEITKFENQYHLKSPVWWYTSKTFIYMMLNRVLRTQDVNTILKMGFFIYDLHQQIEKLHLTQFADKQGLVIVYRGQSLFNDQFKKLMESKGGLISFNSFLSTSEDRQVALAFAQSNSDNVGSVGILFQITVDTRISTTPYARIDEFTQYKAERELLLSMHSVFRIGDIEMSEDNKNLWIVNLKMTEDNDPLLNALTEHLRQETHGTTGWHRLGLLLIKLHKFDKAEEVYQMLLNQCMSDENEKAILFSHLGYIKQEQSDYIMATKFYDQELEILKRILPKFHPRIIDGYEKFGNLTMEFGEYSKAISVLEAVLRMKRNILPPDDPGLAHSYGNIGHAYEKMNDYPKALLAYEKALEIFKRTLPANHPTLAAVYNSIADVYNNVGEYTQALLLYQKALEIKQRILPSDHLTLAGSYNCMASVHFNRGEYSEALSYLETSMAIMQTSDTCNRSDLAACYGNIGSTYESLGEHSKALSFYEKSFQIQQECFQSDHPSVAHCYKKIGSIYDWMGRYSEALLFFEKALKIYQAALPPNHLDLAALYNNIGHVHKNMKQYSNALSHCQKALAICQATLPSNHPALLVSYHNMAKVYHSMKEHSKALVFYQKALEIQENSPAPNHIDLTTVYSSIAKLCMETHEYSQSLLFYKKALDIQQKILPPDHLDLAMTYNGIGTAYRKMGDPYSAIPFLQRFISIAGPYSNQFHSDT